MQEIRDLERLAASSVPTLYDIAGSANWFNKTDNGICVYRNFNKDNPTVDVHIQKVKFKVHGFVGCVTFKYDRKSGRYYEYVPDEKTGFEDDNQTQMWQDK